MVGINHTLAASFRPQTNGKMERYHQTVNRDVNHLLYAMPSDVEAAIVASVSYYNYRRYHKALGNVTPSDVLKGKAAGDPTAQKGGAGSNDRTAKTTQRDPSGSSSDLHPPPDLSGLNVSHFCWLPTAMEEQLRQLADENGRTVSELLREGLRLYLEDCEWRRQDGTQVRDSPRGGGATVAPLPRTILTFHPLGYPSFIDVLHCWWLP